MKPSPTSGTILLIPLEHTGILTSNAPTELIYSPCGTRKELVRTGPAPCTRTDLATVVAGLGDVYAEIDINGSEIAAVRETYQA